MKFDIDYTLSFTKDILSIPSPAGYTKNLWRE